MKRRFRVTIGEKTFEVEVEEIGREPITTSMPMPSTPPSPQIVPTEQPKPVEEEEPSMEVVEEEVVVAPLVGTIRSIMVSENDRVEAGDVLLILEAMKMENEIYASKSGIIKKVAVSEGQSVHDGDILVIIG